MPRLVPTFSDQDLEQYRQPGAGGDPAYISQNDPFFATLKDWGRAMMDLWLHNRGSATVMMTQHVK